MVFCSDWWVFGQVSERKVVARGPSQTLGSERFLPSVSRAWIWSVRPPLMMAWIFWMESLADWELRTRSLITVSFR